MPRNLSAWSDAIINIAIMTVMLLIIFHYNKILGSMAFLVWCILVYFAYARHKDREKNFTDYCENVLDHFNDMMYYATTKLPEGILILDNEGRLQWHNSTMQNFSEITLHQGMHVDEFWKGLVSEKLLSSEQENEGEYKVKSSRHRKNDDGESEEIFRHFQVKYRCLQSPEKSSRIIILYLHEITLYEELKFEYSQSRAALIYAQIDNYDEITQDLNESEKTSLLLSVSQLLEEWVDSLSGFIRRVSSDLFLILLERRALDRAVKEKFLVLDKIRQIVNKNQIQITLSMGAAVAEKSSAQQSMHELSDKAQAGLELALGRGGDQVTVNISDKMQFFGGLAAAVEKNTRVKARVKSRAIRKAMEAADEIFIMGHVREDYDSLGAAIGVSFMAKKLSKPVHIVLSNWPSNVKKLIDIVESDDDYKKTLVSANEVSLFNSISPLLIIVDTFIPELVAAPELLSKIKKIIVIDHHRRSENTIKNAAITYLETSSSSTCEMVTELLMYFDKNIRIEKLGATALYSGIVLDTKNFSIQAGARTFDAAAYLSRSGADPIAVNKLFMDDYATTLTLAKVKANSKYLKGGLIVSSIDNEISNAQAIAGHAADSMLRIEGVQMTIVLFKIKNDLIGISARSKSELNVQVLMEQFGGGGHQTVAGAQVKTKDIDELKQSVIVAAKKYITDMAK